MALASPGSGCVARYAVWPISVGADAGYGKGQDACWRAPNAAGRCEAHAPGAGFDCVSLARGIDSLALLTSRIVPLNAKGVVSFSYRHRPGLSAINCFERDDPDLIDDLIPREQSPSPQSTAALGCAASTRP